MAKYEAMMVTTASLDEEASAKLVDRFKSIIEENGTMLSVDAWGTRRLAYPINDENEGVYTVFNFECEPGFPAELDRRFRITDGVIRSLIVAKDEEEVPAPAAKAGTPAAPAAAAVPAAPAATEAE